MSIRTTSGWSVSAWAIASSPEAARPTTVWPSAATRRWRACATEVFVLDNQRPCDCHGLLLGLRQGGTDGDARHASSEMRAGPSAWISCVSHGYPAPSCRAFSALWRWSPFPPLLTPDPVSHLPPQVRSSDWATAPAGATLKGVTHHPPAGGLCPGSHRPRRPRCPRAPPSGRTHPGCTHQASGGRGRRRVSAQGDLTRDDSRGKETRVREADHERSDCRGLSGRGHRRPGVE